MDIFRQIESRFVDRDIKGNQSWVVQALLRADEELMEQTYGWVTPALTSEETLDELRAIALDMGVTPAFMAEMEAGCMFEGELDEDLLAAELDEVIQENQVHVEVYEWWLVSDWFADKIEQHGGYVLRFGNCAWWGRETTGQGWALDGIVQGIYASLNP